MIQEWKLLLERVSAIQSATAFLTKRLNSTVKVRLVSEPLLDAATGALPGFDSVQIGSRNSSVGTTEELIWEHSAAYAGFATSTESYRVKAGGNANDTAAGTGARSVTLEFLDSDFNRVEETLDTAGASASSATTTKGIRLLRAYVKDAGTYNTAATGAGQANTGNIVIEGQSSGNVLASILAGTGRSQLGIYTIPAGFKGYLRRLRFNVEGNKDADCRVWLRYDANTTSAPFGSKRLFRRLEKAQGSQQIVFDSYIELPAYTDIWATGQVASGTSSVEFYMDILLVKNGSTA